MLKWKDPIIKKVVRTLFLKPGKVLHILHIVQPAKFRLIFLVCKVWVDCFSRNCEELNFNSAKLCKVEENKILKKIFHLCEVEGLVYLCEVEDSDMADVVDRRSRSETSY